MAGKVKDVHLSVYDSELRKTVFTKVFFKMADCKSYVSTEEFIAAWPSPKFVVTKEVY